MSETSVHKISVVLPATNYEEAGKHQTAAKHWARHQLPDILSRYLEPLDTGGEVVYIEKVTITLPDLPWNLSDADWQQHLAEAIQLRAAGSDSLVLIVRQWLFFLAHGCLESIALLRSRQAIEDHLVRHKDQLGRVLLKEWGGVVRAPVWERLFVQHGEELVRAVLEILFDIPAAQSTILYPILRRELRESPAMVYPKLSALLAMNPAVSASARRSLLRHMLEGVRETGPTVSMPQDVKSPTMTTGLIKETLPSNSIACTHAGLVLLFPYIKRYFENAGLLTDETFSDEAARNTAVQALHWLATGAVESPPEELLVLPKLLCGMELSEAIAWSDVLPATLQAEGGALLEAVIGHWQVLQSTSIDGLRQTFLQRNGQLRVQEETYTLQVEESGVDILLNSIPWGFRNFRLPWMRGHLITEWY